MKLLRVVLVGLLSLAVPGTAVAASLNDGHCHAPAQAGTRSAAAATGHTGHVMHNAPASAQAPAKLQHDGNPGHCSCGCACIGTHCLPGGGAAVAIEIDFPQALHPGIAEFALAPMTLSLAHSRGLYRPPSTI